MKIDVNKRILKFPITKKPDILEVTTTTEDESAFTINRNLLPIMIVS